MAASGPKEPEFLEDEHSTTESPLRSTDGASSSLSDRVQRLEDVEASRQREFQELRLQVQALEASGDRVAGLDARAKEAECYADAMATERAAIALERDEALQDTAVKEARLRLVEVALARSEQEREALERKYQSKMSELRKELNAHNDKLKLWEHEMKQVRAENAELKRNNSFLRATFFFEVSPSTSDRQRLKCFSCLRSYSVESQEEACAFHPLPPATPSVWHRWKHGPLSDYRSSEHGDHSYWSCCNTLSPKGRRPEGCRRGPHHQKWEMDVVMKRVMLSRDNVLNEDDEPQCPRILGQV